MDLGTKIKDAGRVYTRFQRPLEKLGITKLEDFLYHIPFRYDDYSILSKIGELQEGERVTVRGKVLEIKNNYIRRGMSLQKAKIDDETAVLNVTWFNQPYLTKSINPGDEISLSGKVTLFARKPAMQSPDYELPVKEEEWIHTGRLVPIYPETRGISSKWIRRQVYKLLKQSQGEIAEYLPKEIIEKESLMLIGHAVEQVHFPKDIKKAEQARKRLAFDELFLMQLGSMIRRSQWEKKVLGNRLSISAYRRQIEEFWKKLPFELTDAQKRAVADIFSDLGSDTPMNRLLEGDVGSGKTVVSAIAMFVTHLNGYQSVLMAPTEILTQQHHKTISDLLSPFDVRVNLITGSQKRGIKNQESRIKKTHDSKFIIRNSSSGFDVLVGTHAVLSKTVNFDKLGLVVIDEQQRFGVEQRSIVREKGKNPHLLTMTATPIPRTIALTMYGDLDLSYLDEMPKGRKLIKTWLVPPEKRNNAYKWIEKQLKEHESQAFIICPFIEESESMQTVKAATIEFEILKNDVFPNLKLGLLHGRVKAKDKEEVLRKFRNKEIDILVATPVVEVGIDIPNATIMLIEAAERFGLAQLHQLRGRVGRGEKQSYCLLFTESENQQTNARLRAMETTNDGAKLAEVDLRLRGPGDLFGTMQHGRKMLKVASFSDAVLIETAKKQALEIFPLIDKHPKLLEKIKQINIAHVSPD